MERTPSKTLCQKFTYVSENSVNFWHRLIYILVVINLKHPVFFTTTRRVYQVQTFWKLTQMQLTSLFLRLLSAIRIFVFIHHGRSSLSCYLRRRQTILFRISIRLAVNLLLLLNILRLLAADFARYH